MPITGSCHCGATKFEIDFTPETATQCNCSFCTKRGALWAYGDPDQFRLLTPIEDARAYARSADNKHYFCPTCGCTTFSDNPDYSAFASGDWAAAEASFDPAKRRISVNLWVLDDFDITALPVTHVDGKSGW